MRISLHFTLYLATLTSGMAILASDASVPLGEPQLERPTLRSLGVYWIIQGDDNQNGIINLAYRKSGSAAWQAGGRLWRVERRAHLMEHGQSDLRVPDDGWLFAGSGLLLEPGTPYELRLTLEDLDGGQAIRTLRASTRLEPIALTSARTFHVVPGSGGGTGTKRDPFQGLDVAQQAATPGDLFLIGPGLYEGSWKITRSGTPGRPIICAARARALSSLTPKDTLPRAPGREYRRQVAMTSGSRISRFGTQVTASCFMTRRGSSSGGVMFGALNTD